MKTSRTVETAGAENVRFGLFALIESRRVILPLKGVECEFTVRGGVVEVSISQIFLQENPRPLDCEYLFPLPGDASVYFCEADINGRLIRAQVKERHEARQIVAEKKAAGFRTALVESERDNLFTLGLGNVQPDDLIIVRLKYFQTLRTLGELCSVEIPSCPGVRYIPGKTLLRGNRGKGIIDDTNQVPDASRLTPVRIDGDHPDAAYIDVRGTLDAKHTDRQSVTSPSHSIEAQASSGELCVTLSNKGEVPDRDFVLRWKERDSETVTPRAWTRNTGKETYALLEVRAPRQVAAERSAVDFYFLVDRSGSMQGEKWNKAIEALQSCLRVLGPYDRAMITLFESHFQDFAEEPLPAQELLADPQFQRLQQMGTGGGTEMAPALRHVLEIAKTDSAGRDQNLILITDAQVGNDSAILDLMKSAPDLPVHCFGIDIALNDALLLALSRQQGGTFHSLNPNDDIEAAVTQLGKTLGQPALLDLKLSKGWESADAKIPNLYAGQILYLSARASSDKPLELTARTPAGKTVSYRFEPEVIRGDAPRLHWCKTRIQRLLAEGNNREAIKVSVTSNLLCRLTAFVAWDESEKVMVARHELVQPSMAPAACAAPKAMAGKRMIDKSVAIGVRAAAAVQLREQLADYAPTREPIRKAKKQPNESPNAITRFLRRLHPNATIQDLHLACKRLGGSDLRSLYQTIADWFTGATGFEIAQQTEPLKRLIAVLNVCSEFKEALFSAGSPAKDLKNCQLRFRKLQREWNSATGELKELENVFHRTGSVESAALPGQLPQLAQEIDRAAIGLLKAFADSLPVRK